MSLEKLIESHYAPKKGNELLIKLIEGKLNEQITNLQPISPWHYGDERYFKFRTINLSNKIGQALKEGEALNYDRQFIDLIADQLKQLGIVNTSENESFESRIAAYQAFFDAGVPDKENQKNYTVSNIMTICMISDALYHLINDYDDKVAGKLFEPLFAGLFSGTFIEGEGGKTNYDVPDVKDIPTEGGGVREVSLKLIGAKTDVEQSFTNVLNYLSQNEVGAEKGIMYVVAYKETKSKISFYKFELNKDNWMEMFSNIKNLFTPQEIQTLSAIQDTTVRINQAKELYSERAQKIKNFSSRIKQEEVMIVGKTNFLKSIGHTINRQLSRVSLMTKKSYSIEAIIRALDSYIIYLNNNKRTLNYPPLNYENELNLMSDAYEYLKNLGSNRNLKVNYYSEDDLSQRTIQFLKDFIDDYNRRVGIIEEATIGKEEVNINILSKQDKMLVSSSSVRTQENYLGAMEYGQDKLENILRGYTEIINYRIIEIYDNLKIYNNVIDDFFMKAQKREDKQQLMNISKESAKNIEDNLAAIIKGSEE